MAIVFHVAEDPNAAPTGLLENMRTATFAGSTRKIFTTSTTLGLIVFFFFSLQCLSTVSVVRSETNSWRMAGLQLLFYTGIGYVMASALVLTLRLLGVD
jgi:ferrous iron transport protein B